jgi:hypothetical protein
VTMTCSACEVALSRRKNRTIALSERVMGKSMPERGGRSIGKAGGVPIRALSGRR